MGLRIHRKKQHKKAMAAKESQKLALQIKGNLNKKDNEDPNVIDDNIIDIINVNHEDG